MEDYDVPGMGTQGRRVGEDLPGVHKALDYLIANER